MGMLELLLKGRTDIPNSITINNRPAEFLWGLKYSIEQAYPESSENMVKFELLYEILPTKLNKLFGAIFKKLNLAVQEDLLSPVPYAVSLTSLEDIPKLQKGYIPADYRCALFASKKHYKAFFQALNDDLINGLVSNEDYMRISERVNIRSKKALDESMKPAMFLKKSQTIKEFREVFCNDPLLRPYLDRAEFYVKNPNPK